MTAKATRTNRVLFLSHGGGPLPLLGDPGHQGMIDFIARVTPSLGRPAAIVVVSAHWEEPGPTVTGGASPPLIHDYYGFPEESYRIEYPAPGHPELAGKIVGLLNQQGMNAKLDKERGFDHGLFVPLKLMYPDAEIPCVQLSLASSLDPELHIRMGEALSSLAADNILVIGSGFSFHNMKAFSGPANVGYDEANKAFEAWLRHSLSDPVLSEQERRRRLVEWHQAPGARLCHPREEHLLPLQLCYGVAGQGARQAFSMEILGKRASAFLW